MMIMMMMMIVLICILFSDYVGFYVFLFYFCNLIINPSNKYDHDDDDDDAYDDDDYVDLYVVFRSC